MVWGGHRAVGSQPSPQATVDTRMKPRPIGASTRIALSGSAYISMGNTIEMDPTNEAWDGLVEPIEDYVFHVVTRGARQRIRRQVKEKQA